MGRDANFEVRVACLTAPVILTTSFSISLERISNTDIGQKSDEVTGDGTLAPV